MARHRSRSLLLTVPAVVYCSCMIVTRTSFVVWRTRRLPGPKMRTRSCRSSFEAPESLCWWTRYAFLFFCIFAAALLFVAAISLKTLYLPSRLLLNFESGVPHQCVFGQADCGSERNCCPTLGRDALVEFNNILRKWQQDNILWPLDINSIHRVL